MHMHVWLLYNNLIAREARLISLSCGGAQIYSLSFDLVWVRVHVEVLIEPPPRAYMGGV